MAGVAVPRGLARVVLRRWGRVVHDRTLRWRRVAIAVSHLHWGVRRRRAVWGVRGRGLVPRVGVGRARVRHGRRVRRRPHAWKSGRVGGGVSGRGQGHGHMMVGRGGMLGRGTIARRRGRAGERCGLCLSLSLLRCLTTAPSPPACTLHTLITALGLEMVRAALAERALVLGGLVLGVVGGATTAGRTVDSRVLRGEPGRLAEEDNVNRWGALSSFRQGGDDTVALPDEFCVICGTSSIRVWGRNLDQDVRRPQALQRVRWPSGPRRHSGVSRISQEWHWPGGEARWRGRVR